MGADPVTVLVIDDDPDMRHYVGTCLRRFAPSVGRILEAEDGLEALAVVRSGVVDAVVSDVALPRMDGVALCRAIRRDAPVGHLPILLISGEHDHVSAGVPADAFLAKPFNATQLLAAIETCLARRPRAPPVADGPQATSPPSRRR